MGHPSHSLLPCVLQFRVPHKKEKIPAFLEPLWFLQHVPLDHLPNTKVVEYDVVPLSPFARATRVVFYIEGGNFGLEIVDFVKDGFCFPTLVLQDF